IEFGHRMVSGVALLLVFGLGWRIFRGTPKGHPARLGGVLSMVAIVVESLIGAMIVFYEWVADDASAARVISVPLHLVNTLALLAALTFTVFWVSGGRRFERGSGRTVLYLIGAGMLAISATGGVTALADTLFPKDGFTLGGMFTVQTSEHFLTNLRSIHPVVAIVIGFAAASWAFRRAWYGETAIAARVVVGSVIVQTALGFANVITGTPLVLTLLHLLVADALWIGWVWICASRFQAVPESSPVEGYDASVES
ncbi:MAG: COX15/CtaA family protein, partial [Acidimicrobiia bacterium]|nr:COX15/CtaA family protein [Acidimicrobiia bacterium]